MLVGTSISQRLAFLPRFLCIFFMSLSVEAKTTTPKKAVEYGPLTVVQAVESGRVLLPCNVIPPASDDDVILVLFYRGTFGTPFYSVDGRSGPVREGKHWTDKSAIANRAKLDLTSHPPALIVDPVLTSDHDEYRCRVDYHSHPTRNVRIQLQVIVPPRDIRIETEAGLEVSGVIGPYPVGNDVKLKCQVESGHPAPRVTWWNEATLLDDDVETRSDITINQLTLTSLTRDDLYRVLTCQASNSNLSNPIAAAVTLDMSFPPLNVRIVGPVKSVSEGEKTRLMCETTGSRPSATITWYKDGLLMTDSTHQILQDGNVTRSTLQMTPTRADHDIYIQCRAQNPTVPAAVLEDVIKLNVHYKPRLSLAAGQNLDMEDIKEGDDVYFECGIKANPKVYKVQWFRNDEELSHNVSAGVIQSNQSLVLQKVTRTSSGQYTCTAANLQGEGHSNSANLSVKFAPHCRSGQKVVYGAGKLEELNVTCSVEAYPDPVSFRWAFNSSSEVMEMPADKIKQKEKSISQVSYTPRSHLDYGSLLCWATNDVATQTKPCIYHIIHAAPPDPVNNCTVENVSSTGADVRCEAGWDGGLTQTFTLSVAHGRAHTRGSDDKKSSPRVLANTSTSPRPEFTLTGLQPGTAYHLTINGVNKKGQSEPVRLDFFTLKDIAEKRTSPGVGELALAPILTVVLGSMSGLVVIIVVIAVVVVKTRRRRRARPEIKMVYDKGASSCSAAAPRNQDDTTDSDEANNPDVIPLNDDHQVKESLQDYAVEELSDTEHQLSDSQQQLQQQTQQQQQQQSQQQQQQQQESQQQPQQLHLDLHYDLEHDPHHSFHQDIPYSYQQDPHLDLQQESHQDIQCDPHHSLQHEPLQDAQQNLIKDYLQSRAGSYYVDPNSYMMQRASMPPLDTDPLLMVGRPIHNPVSNYPLDMSSTHTLPLNSPHGMSSTPASPTYPQNLQNRMSYPQTAISSTPAAAPPPSYLRRRSQLLPPSYDMSGATLPRSFSRGLPGGPYSHRLSLNQEAVLPAAGRSRPASSMSFTHQGFASPIAGSQDGESRGLLMGSRRSIIEDIESQRESSV